MNNIDLPYDLVRLANIIGEYAPLYLVGGAVRDSLIGRGDSGDYDIAAKLTIDELTVVLHDKHYGLSGIYPRTGTVVVHGENFKAEYTTFRRDSYPIGSGAHAPSEVIFTDNITEDAIRRDFTCNAIYYNIGSGEYVDPLCGADDIVRKVLVTTGSPQRVLAEDALRILRLVRFACELGFEIDNETYLVAIEYAPRLIDISIERIREELIKILSAKRKYPGYNAAKLPSYGLVMLMDMGILKARCGSDISHATLLAMDKLSDAEHCCSDLNRHIALLYYDSGLEIARNWLNKLKFSNKEKRDVIITLEGLSELRVISTESGLNYSQMKRFIRKYYERIKDICALSAALELGGVVTCLEESLANINELKIPMTVKALKINGNDLRAMGVDDIQIGSILNDILDSSIDREKVTQDEQLCIARELLRIKN